MMRTLGFAGVGFLLMGSAAAVTPTISLHYNPRVPYEYEQDGHLSGVLVGPVTEAFRAAGVPFRWVSTPALRQFAVIQANSGHDCSVGRYKTSDREAYAQFSVPFYRNRSDVALSRRDQKKMAEFTSLEKLVQDPDLRFLVKEGYSYGSVIQEWIKVRSKPPRGTTGENVSMLREVFFGQADFFLLSEEEAEALIAHVDLPKEQLQIHHFADAPAGGLRYLMCSRKVPADVLQKINQYLPAVKEP